MIDRINFLNCCLRKKKSLFNNCTVLGIVLVEKFIVLMSVSMKYYN